MGDALTGAPAIDMYHSQKTSVAHVEGTQIANFLLPNAKNSVILSVLSPGRQDIKQDRLNC